MPKAIRPCSSGSAKSRRSTHRPESSGTILSDFAHGTFFGVVDIGERVNDRRGDRIAPGLYVLRLSAYPEHGAHQRVSPHRDFFILTSAATDVDPKLHRASPV